MAKKISVINFKGGVGKTSLAFHLATGLVKYYSNKVLLIDTDHQSSLSIICLQKKGWEDAVNANMVLTRVFEHFTEDDSILPGDEIIIHAPLGNSYQELDFVAGSLRLDEVELDLASTTKGNAVTSEWKKRMLLCEWLEKNNVESKYDYIMAHPDLAYIAEARRLHQCFRLIGLAGASQGGTPKA